MNCTSQREGACSGAAALQEKNCGGVLERGVDWAMSRAAMVIQSKTKQKQKKTKTCASSAPQAP